MKRTVAAVLLVAVALLVAVVGLRDRGTAGFPLDLASASVLFVESGNRLTPSDARVIFGEPDEVFRTNASALCWRFVEAGGGASMCWGKRREQAWISVSGDAARAVATHSRRKP